jgi:hypothetical protein
MHWKDLISHRGAEAAEKVNIKRTPSAAILACPSERSKRAIDLGSGGASPALQL